MPEGTCYLFLGPELGDKKDAIDAVRKKSSSQSGTPPEETSFYIGVNEVSEVMSVAMNGSLFAESRLILVKNVDLIKKKDEIAAVTGYIHAPKEATVMILIAETTKIESEIEKCFDDPSDNPLKKNKKIFWELFEERKTQYVERFFRQAGFGIDDAATARVLEMVENNTEALRQECSKITLFLRSRGAQQGAIISAEQIEQLLAHSKQETVFSLFSAITSGDFQKSLGIARVLLNAQTAPQAIFGFLAAAFRKYRDYCELVHTGADNDFNLKKIGITLLGKKDYVNARRIYGEAADRLLSLTAEYDIASRASPVPELIIDMYLYKLFSLKSGRRTGY